MKIPRFNLFADEYRHLRVYVRAYLDYGTEKPDAAWITIKQEAIIRSGECWIWGIKGKYLLTVLHIQTYIIIHNNTVTVLLIGMCLFVACSSRIKVQSLVDFNEVPAEEKLPLVCQITFGFPCMPFSHHRSIAPMILYFIPLSHDIT